VAAKAPKFRVLKGINYPPDDKRAEPGDIVDDLPESSIRGLLHDDAIEPADEKKTETGK
jgi:hypothetical protein